MDKDLRIVVKRGDVVVRDSDNIRQEAQNETEQDQKDSRKFSNSWSIEDFDVIITINGIKMGKKDGKLIKLGASKSKASTKVKAANENPYQGVVVKGAIPKQKDPNAIPPQFEGRLDEDVNIPVNKPVQVVNIDMGIFNRAKEEAKQVNTEKISAVKVEINQDESIKEREAMINTALNIMGDEDYNEKRETIVIENAKSYDEHREDMTSEESLNKSMEDLDGFVEQTPAAKPEEEVKTEEISEEPVSVEPEAETKEEEPVEEEKSELIKTLDEQLDRDDITEEGPDDFKERYEEIKRQSFISDIEQFGLVEEDFERSEDEEDEEEPEEAESRPSDSDDDGSGDDYIGNY